MCVACAGPASAAAVSAVARMAAATLLTVTRGTTTRSRCQALTATTPSPALGAARRRPARDDPVRRTGPHQAPIRRRRPRKLCSSGVRRCATARVSFSWRCRPPARPGLSLRGRASAPKVRGGTGKTGRTSEAVERRAANSRAGPSHLPLQRRDLDPPAVDGSSGRLFWAPGHRPGSLDLLGGPVAGPRVGLVVVAIDVGGDHLPVLVEGLERVAPDAALLELREPALDEPCDSVAVAPRRWAIPNADRARRAPRANAEPSSRQESSLRPLRENRVPDRS